MGGGSPPTKGMFARFLYKLPKTKTKIKYQHMPLNFAKYRNHNSISYHKHYHRVCINYIELINLYIVYNIEFFRGVIYFTLWRYVMHLFLYSF